MIGKVNVLGVELTYRRFIFAGIVAQTLMFQGFFEAAYGSFIRMYYQRIFQAIAVLVFPVSYAIFSFFYSMYGAVLYVVGPLVLALYPALGVGQLARTFMVNLLVWNAWGIIYAIISQLLTIMSANSLTSIFTSQSFGGAFQGAFADQPGVKLALVDYDDERASGTVQRSLEDVPVRPAAVRDAINAESSGE